MKKVLLASAAVLALGTISAQAADPIKLGITGNVKEFVGIASNQSSAVFTAGANPAAAATAADKRADFNEYQDGTIDFTGSTKLDNGITVKVDALYNPTEGTHDNGGTNVAARGSWVTVSGIFGAVELGETPNVVKANSFGAPTAMALFGQDNDIGNWVANPYYHKTVGQTYFGADGFGDRATYLTPSFGGLQAGVSYGVRTNPNGGQQGMPSVSTISGTASDAGNSDSYAAVLLLNRDFGPVGVKAYIGDAAMNTYSEHEISGAAKVTYLGFEVGGSYGDRDTSKNHLSEVNGGKSKAYDLGVGYVTGPFEVTFNYYHDQSKNFSTAAGQLANYNGGVNFSNASSFAVGDDKTSAYGLEGAYTMGPGITLVGAVGYIKYDSSASLKQDENKGWIGATGIKVAF